MNNFPDTKLNLQATNDLALVPSDFKRGVHDILQKAGIELVLPELPPKPVTYNIECKQHSVTIDKCTFSIFNAFAQVLF